MTSRRPVRLLLALAFTLGAARTSITAQVAPAAAAPASLPARIADAEYWKLVNDLAEPGGYFRIPDNFTSNEMEVGWIFTRLQDQKVNGGVYLGVGPEQNLSYIAAIRPKMAVLFDIRRQAMVQHQMFKAIFELSPDRADFLAMLFAKPRPAKLDGTTEIRAMWDAYWYVPTDTALARRNWDRIHDHLVKTHAFTFAPQELAMMKNVYDAFIAYGPVITTNGGQNSGRQPANTFADMTGYSYDAAGIPRSFMSSEDNYRYVRGMHQNNLILTVTGDFGGPKAIRAVGEWLKARGGVVSAFYVSNVEQYLFMDGKQGQFYANVATLPFDEKSVFIRPYSMRNFNRGGGYGTTNSLCPIGGFLRAANAGRVYSNDDALACPVM
ncbi:MAG TPA: hypothetical protein VFO55_09625 [Gemmatimonadaceae bacterium]|nr:hypothetical protein [Gemmatimonadaceae bacterium]